MPLFGSTLYFANRTFNGSMISSTLSENSWFDLMLIVCNFVPKVGDEMVKYLDDFATNGKEFECKDLFTMYSVDVVATTGFGVEAQSFANPDGTFLDQVPL